MSLIKSRPFLAAIVLLAELILLLAVFRVGVLVGFRKASFSFGWGSRHGGWQGGFGGDNYINGTGTVGTVASVGTSTLTVQGPNSMQKSFIVTPKTAIRKNGLAVQLSQLQVNDQVMILGTPSSTGEITASLIRAVNGLMRGLHW